MGCGICWAVLRWAKPVNFCSSGILKRPVKCQTLCFASVPWSRWPTFAALAHGGLEGLVLPWDCIPCARSWLHHLLRKLLWLGLYFQILEKSRALLAPLVSQRELALASCFLLHFFTVMKTIHSVFSLILPPYSSMVLALDLFERFPLKLVSVRNSLCSHTKLLHRNIYLHKTSKRQTLRHSRPCAVGVSVSHW